MENVCEVKQITGEKWVVFNDYFNEKLSLQILDLMVKYQKVQFGTSFNQPISCNTDISQDGKYISIVPNGVTHIKFIDILDDDLYFPNEEEKSMFNQPVNNLPNSLIYLEFGYHFNQPVDNLPDSLTHLEFGNKFNKPVDHLPEGLQYLQFGYSFNQSVENLPKSLKILKLSTIYNLPLINLPQHLEELELGEHFNHPIRKEDLPKNLKKIKFGFAFNHPIEGDSPTGKFSIFPDSLEEVKLGMNFDYPINILPNSLRVLNLHRNYRKKVSYFPSSLKEIKIGVEYEYIEEIPKEVKIHLLRRQRGFWFY